MKKITHQSGPYWEDLTVLEKCYEYLFCRITGQIWYGKPHYWSARIDNDMLNHLGKKYLHDHLLELNEVLGHELADGQDLKPGKTLRFVKPEAGAVKYDRKNREPYVRNPEHMIR